MTQTPGVWSPFAGLTGVPPKAVPPGAVEQAKAKAALVRETLFGPERWAVDASRFEAAVAAPIPADVFTFGAPSGLSPGKSGARAPDDPGGGPALGNPVTAGNLATNMVGTLGPAPGLAAAAAAGPAGGYPMPPMNLGGPVPSGLPASAGPPFGPPSPKPAGGVPSGESGARAPDEPLGTPASPTPDEMYRTMQHMTNTLQLMQEQIRVGQLRMQELQATVQHQAAVISSLRSQTSTLSSALRGSLKGSQTIQPERRMQVPLKKGTLTG